MKRVLAVLVLTVAGLLTTSIFLTPQAALATEPEQEGLQVPDLRDGTILDAFGRPDDDSDGDPDSLTGGFGFINPTDPVQDLNGYGDVPGNIETWEDLISYLLMSYWSL